MAAQGDGEPKRKKAGPFRTGDRGDRRHLFGLFIDKMLPLERWFGELPIFIRVFAAVTAGLFGWLAWRYWDIFGGADEPRGSRERGDYDALLDQLKSGGTPAKVYRDWLTEALDRGDVFFGDPGGTMNRGSREPWV